MNIFDITITNIGETYDINTEKNQITCTLRYHINLKEFEREHFIFTKGFVKKHLSEHIGIIYTILDCDTYGNYFPCEKYLIDPSGSVKVLMDFDKYHYGDIITKKDVTSIERAKIKYNSNQVIDTYDYVETFTIKATTTLAEGDEYNLELGKGIAYAKAAIKAHKRGIGIINRIDKKLLKVHDKMNDSIAISQEKIASLEEIYNNVTK